MILNVALENHSVLLLRPLSFRMAIPIINQPANKKTPPTGATAPNHFKELKLIMYKLPQNIIVPSKIKKGEQLNNLLGVNFRLMINPIIIKPRELNI